MKLANNPTFQRHKIQIEEALLKSPEPSRTVGYNLFKQMLITAEQLDESLEIRDGMRPTPQSIALKRDDFHRKCRDLGEWLNSHAPELNLSWD